MIKKLYHIYPNTSVHNILAFRENWTTPLYIAETYLLDPKQLVGIITYRAAQWWYEHLNDNTKHYGQRIQE